MYKSFNRLFFLALFMIFAALAAIAYFGYANNKEYRTSSEWVNHTYDVLSLISRVSSLSKDLQLESVYFSQTKDPTSLDRYKLIRHDLKISLVNIAKLLRDNRIQSSRMDTIITLQTTMIRDADKVVGLNDLNNSSQIEMTGNIRDMQILRQLITAYINEFMLDENRLLDIRSDQNNESINATSNYFLGSLMLMFVFQVFVISLTFYYFNERRRSQKILQESEDRFKLIIDNIREVGIIMMDPDGIILNWYRGAKEITGYKNEDVNGMHHRLMYTDEDINHSVPEKDLKKAAVNGSYHIYGWRKRQDHSVFWAEIYITSVVDGSGNIIAFTQVLKDQSDQKMIEEERERAFLREKELNEMKSNFVSIASHEFRTPLSAISTSLSLIEKYADDDMLDKRQKHIRKIRMATNEMVSILEEFLSIEKVETGRIDFKPARCVIETIFTGFVNDFSSLLKSNQALFYKHQGEPDAYIDSSLLKYVISNLISNAAKYSGEGSLIHVTTLAKEGRLTIMVKDRGIGISIVDQKKLFGRFYRASNAGNVPGTGLGLHIVKKYTELMDGTISIKSELNEGSEFVIDIPCLERDNITLRAIVSMCNNS